MRARLRAQVGRKQNELPLPIDYYGREMVLKSFASSSTSVLNADDQSVE
jgi:hypothetical protein